MPCDTWQLPNGTYFQYMTIGYDIYGDTYIKAVTDNRVVFERGFLKQTDSS